LGIVSIGISGNPSPSLDIVNTSGITGTMRTTVVVNVEMGAMKVKKHSKASITEPIPQVEVGGSRMERLACAGRYI
jgi:hypothetical protein